MTLPIIPAALYGDIDLYPNIETSAYGDSVSAVTSYDIPLPASLAAGNLILVMMTVANVTGATTITPQGGWEELYNDGTQGNIRRWAAYWRESDGLEGSVFPITISTGSGVVSIAYQISNWTGIEATANAGNFDTIANPPELTPTWGNAHCLWIAAQGRATTVAPSSAPADYDDLEGSILSSAIGPQIATARRELRAASENPGEFGVTAAFWRGSTIAIKGYG